MWGAAFFCFGREARSGLQGPDQVYHLDGALGAVGALVAGLGAGPLHGLLDGIGGQHAEEVGLTRLFYVLGEQGYLNDGLVTSPADVLVLPMTEDFTAAISFATQLRQGGVRAQVYGEQKKFKGKMSYADKLGIPYVAFLGEDEIAQGVVKIKDMATGEQHTLSPAQAVDTVAAALAQRAQGKPIREKD